MDSLQEIRVYVKEAFALLEKVNSFASKEYESFLNHDLTPKQFLLLRTVRLKQRMTVNELSEALSLSPSSVSQLIKKLEKEQYLKREVNPDNRREIFVQLDTQGIRLFQEYQKVDDSLIERYYSKFTVDEVVQFRDLVKKLYTTMESSKTTN